MGQPVSDRAERRRQARALVKDGMIYRSTGVDQEASIRFGAQIPDLPPGEHLWLLFAAFRVRDPESTGQQHLDMENLVTIDGPGCYYCEAPYTRALAARPCGGDRTGLTPRRPPG